jgi:hypothetical protein
MTNDIVEFFNNKKSILKYEINTLIENLNKVYAKYDTVTTNISNELSNTQINHNNNSNIVNNNSNRSNSDSNNSNSNNSDNSDSNNSDSNNSDIDYINGLIDKMILINDNVELIKSQIDDVNYCIDKKEITNANKLSLKIKEHDDMLKIWNTFLPSMLLYKMSME